MKFRIKIMLCMVALMALLFGIGGSVLIAISFQGSLKQEQKTAQSSYQMLIRTLRILGDTDMWQNGSDVSDSLKNLMEEGGTLWSDCRFSVFGDVVYQKGEHQDMFRSLKEQIDGGHYAVAYVSGRDGRHYMQLSGMLVIGEETLYLDVLYDISSVYETRELQDRMFYRIFAVMLISCLIVAWFLSWLLTRPLTRLSKAAKEFAAGNLSYRSDIRTSDEIGLLSQDFDYMADQLKRSIEEIRTSMERQEAFMGSFAHELKTPMTSVIGYADLIRGQTLSAEESTEAANYIFSEGKRLESLSQKLLTVFMLDRQEEPFGLYSPGQLIRELLERLVPIYRSQQIDLKAECERGKCRMDPELVQTLLLNLIDNARKALEGGGEIVILSEMTKDGCRICCRDNGRGIPREALDHLTEAFYRVDKSRSREQGGVGLGLALCRKIAEMHRGDITFESSPGEGTAVTVRLRGGRT